jgi:uncharacterized Zn-finger protein
MSKYSRSVASHQPRSHLLSQVTMTCTSILSCGGQLMAKNHPRLQLRRTIYLRVLRPGSSSVRAAARRNYIMIKIYKKHISDFNHPPPVATVAKCESIIMSSGVAYLNLTSWHRPEWRLMCTMAQMPLLDPKLNIDARCLHGVHLRQIF